METSVKEQKIQRFVARVTVADKRLFQKAAVIERRSMAKFVVTLIREVALQVIHQNHQIQLDANESRRFVESLIAPPRKPALPLKQAIVRYRQQVREA
ncbi:MAG TPA: DUF1778 domain-containing protein [Candidatus Saccharimonadales bacterium]|nr:DUF1778 domain-containing protein [Candidatus Saccharimonadales bacterium]